MCLVKSILKIVLGARVNLAVTFRDFPELISVNASRFILIHPHFFCIMLDAVTKDLCSVVKIRHRSHPYFVGHVCGMYVRQKKHQVQQVKKPILQ